MATAGTARHQLDSSTTGRSQRAGSSRRGTGSRLTEALAALEATVAEVAFDDVPPPLAGALVEDLARAERMVTALRVRLAHRVASAGGHRANGDRDPASYLARVSRSSPRRARTELLLAERLAHLPELATAYQAGRLSTDQAQVVAGAAELDPTATGKLVEAAQAGSFNELRHLAARAERAARSEQDQVGRERHVHGRRYCRVWAPPEGGLRVDALVSALEGARLVAALTKETGRLLEDSEEPAERLRADALVELCCGETVQTQVLVRADAAALMRREVEGDEICEVDGVGPISLGAARSILGDGFVTLLLTKGADIATVTSTTRVVPRKVRMALIERDRCCVVPGCGAKLHLEIDHWRLDFSKGGLTALDNLCRLCSVHHKRKTLGLLTLGGGPGRWFVTTPTRGDPWAG